MSNKREIKIGDTVQMQVWLWDGVKKHKTHITAFVYQVIDDCRIIVELEHKGSGVYRWVNLNHSNVIFKRKEQL